MRPEAMHIMSYFIWLTIAWIVDYHSHFGSWVNVKSTTKVVTCPKRNVTLLSALFKLYRTSSQLWKSWWSKLFMEADWQRKGESMSRQTISSIGDRQVGQAALKSLGLISCWFRTTFLQSFTFLIASPTVSKTAFSKTLFLLQILSHIYLSTNAGPRKHMCTVNVHSVQRCLTQSQPGPLAVHQHQALDPLSLLLLKIPYPEAELHMMWGSNMLQPHRRCEVIQNGCRVG